MSTVLGFLLTSLANAAPPVADDAVDELQPFMHSSRDVTCASSRQRGPPAGALAIRASPLGWVQDQREAIRLDHPVLADPTASARWLEATTDFPAPDQLAFAASASPLDGTADRYAIALEARAWRRHPQTFPNFTVVVDTSGSMSTIFTRDYPALLDEDGPLVFRPVTRGALIRAALDELLARIPPQSKVSIVAMDGLNARVAMMAGSVADTLAMERAIPRLVPGYVQAYHPLVHAELDRISDLTFTPCHDNRVILLTDHVTEVFQRETIRSVARWGKGDVDVWSFGVGVRGDMRAHLEALADAAGGAAWMINGRSDAVTIWESMLDPGGVVHRDLQVALELPAGARWREQASGPWMTGEYRRHLGDPTSGTAWARVLEVWLPAGEEPRFAGVATYTNLDGAAHLQRADLVPVPLPQAAPWARTRTALHFWANGQGDRVSRSLVEAVGQGTEIRAWMAHLDPSLQAAWAPDARVVPADELEARRAVLTPPTVEERAGTLPCRAQDDASRDLPRCGSGKP